MVLRLLYMVPMLLGRTYDANKNKIGIDIFPASDTQEPKVIAETYFGSSYKTVDNTTDIKEFLGVTGDLSLKIKADLIQVKGGGGYFHERLKSEKSVDVLIKVNFKTYSESLPPSATPITNWLRINREFLGTHYVRSIIYGGDLLAVVSFKAVRDEDLTEIKGHVKASLEKGSALQLVADGTLDMLQKQLTGVANMEVRYYATVPIESVPQNLDGLKDLVANFKQQVEKENNGWGVPMEVELQELSAFESRMEFLKDAVLESELEMFEDSFDDLLSTKMRIKNWLTSVPIFLSKDDEKKIDDLMSRISNTLRVFFDVIANLDLTQGPDQLETATEAYRKNGKSRLVGKFRRELDRLIKNTVAELEEAPKKGSATYIHYGKGECSTRSDTTTLLSGYLAASPSQELGNGRSYLCLPKQPIWDDSITVSGNSSALAGVKYGLLSGTPFADHIEMVFQGIVCSVCLASERSSFVVFQDSDSCPKDSGWTEEYRGYLMTSSDVNKGEFVCIDKSPESHTDSYMEHSDQGLTMVRANFNGDAENNNYFVQCSVCTK